MTNERAIELLNRISDSQFDGIHGDERREALEMAVKALESNLVKDLVEDTISRQQAIDAFEPTHYIDWYTPTIIETLEALPSAQPQWIPCSERLPSKGEYVLTMLEYKYAKHMGIMKRVNDYPKGEVWEDDFGYSVCDERVPAWMPLPKPYGGESDEL